MSNVDATEKEDADQAGLERHHRRANALRRPLRPVFGSRVHSSNMRTLRYYYHCSTKIEIVSTITFED